MLAWFEELITGRWNQKSWLWRHCRRRAIYWLPDHPRKLVTLNPKLKSTGAGRYQLLSRWWDAHCKALGLKDFSPKVRTLWHCSRLRSVGALPMIDRGDIRQQSTVAAISGLHCRWCQVAWAVSATAWLQNSKKRAERSEIDVASRVTADDLHFRLSASSSARHGLLIINDNAITYKAQRDKMPRIRLRTRQLLIRDAGAWCCCARCKIHEGVSWC